MSAIKEDTEKKVRECDIRKNIMSCEECGFCREDEEEEDYEY